MATITKPTAATIYEDGGATMMARITGAAGTDINQAAITGATVAVYDLDGAAPTTAASTATLVVATVVFDALQTDARWTFDSTGYNFRDTRPEAAFATGGHRYRIEYSFDPVSGEDFWVTFDLYANPVLTS